MSLTVAWHGFVLWAVQQPAMRAQFSHATRIELPSRTSKFDSSDRSLLDFAMWVTIAHWGTEGVPEQFMTEAQERFPGLMMETE